MEANDVPINYMQYLELIKRMTSIAGRLNEIESTVGGAKRKWRDDVDLRLSKLEKLQTPIAGKEEKVDQTLTEKIRKAKSFLTPQSSEYLAEIATSHFQPIIEQARKEGFQNGTTASFILNHDEKTTDILIEKGKRLAIAEIKEKLLRIERFSSFKSIHSRDIDELLSQDK